MGEHIHTDNLTKARKFPNITLLPCILLCISLFVFAILTCRSVSFPSVSSINFPYVSTQSSDSTQLEHLVFGLSGSAKTLGKRLGYMQLWWTPNTTRGFVWLDKDPPLGSKNSYPPYRVSARVGWARSPADRLARILKESFELDLPNVRWFVMGDDDTFYFVDNLVSVLAKYDHREMYYVGGVSETVEQSVRHGYDTAFGGGGYAVSYPLASELVQILDGCIERYHYFYGSDEKVSACVNELGVPLTREAGFHQMDLSGDTYGFLAAHPVAPLVSLHHLDHIQPLFPGQTQLDSLRRLMQAYQIDPTLTAQQSFCYDRRYNWSVSISWGYSAQLYPFLLSSRELSKPIQTFQPWRKPSALAFNARAFQADPCQRPIIYFLGQVQNAGEGKTMSTYKRAATVKSAQRCNQTVYANAMSVDNIVVTALKTDSVKWMKAPRRQCCEITIGWSKEKSGNMSVLIRSCKPREAMGI